MSRRSALNRLYKSIAVTQLIIWSYVAESAVGPATVTKVRMSQDSSPHVYCWATREIDDGRKRAYYFSRVWAMTSDGPTIGIQPDFNSFVNARYSSKGGTSAQCLKFYGRSEAERRLNDLAAEARRNGNEVVFTRWWP